MHLFYQPDIPAGTLHLDDEESRHAVKVMRLKSGDSIQLTDGKGSFYTANITEAHHKKCAFEIINKEDVKPYSTFRHLAIAPTKNLDRTEWFVEKAVELGVDRISFLLGDHSERKVLKLDRIVKKAIGAMKQSGQAFMPQLDELTSIKNFINEATADHKFIAYVDFENEALLKDKLVNSASNLVMIGPEGDFSEREVEMAVAAGFAKVSLGANRLRTETAGMAAVHLMNLV